jgi:hypothetical protein
VPSSPAPLDLYNNPEPWRWAGGMEGIRLSLTAKGSIGLSALPIVIG